jgi:hypothetical protein
MRMPLLATNFEGLHVPIARNQRITLIQDHGHDVTNLKDMEKRLDIHAHLFLPLGINHNTYCAFI